MTTSTTIATVERGRLADLLRGIGRPRRIPLEDDFRRNTKKLKKNTVGVGFCGNKDNPQIRFMVIPGNDRREFFAWMNTYCSFATPLSQWCHVLTEREFKDLTSLQIFPNYRETIAAWAGVAIGETYLRLNAPKNLDGVSLTLVESCISFAVARSFGLWGNLSERLRISEKFQTARKLLGAPAVNEVEFGIEDVWNVLERVASKTSSEKHADKPCNQLIVQSCIDIQNTGFVCKATLQKILDKLGWPKEFIAFESGGAEERLSIFDNATSNLVSSVDGQKEDQRPLAEFIVAYLAARIGGSTASGRLAHVSELLDYHPTVALWFGLASALFRPLTWGVEFGGLAMVVIKQLSAPLRIDDPPQCDITLDELKSLIDPNEIPQLVRVRGASLRTLCVELENGTNVAIPCPSPEEKKKGDDVPAKLQSSLFVVHQQLLELADESHRIWRRIESQRRETHNE